MKFLIRLLLKIIAFPFVVALTILVPFLTFIFCFSEWICTVVAVLLAGLGILTFITNGSIFNGIVLIVLGFLVSPFGIRSVIEWFIGKLSDFNYSLRDFITS